MAKIVVELDFDQDEERRLAVRPRHRDYLRELLTRGKLYMAGPWADEGGALIIYEVNDEAEAQQLWHNDPYREAEVVTLRSMRTWTPILPA